MARSNLAPLGPVAQSDLRSTGDLEDAGVILWSGNILSWTIFRYHESFHGHSPLPADASRAVASDWRKDGH